MKNLLTFILVLVVLFITHASYADRAYENDEKTVWESGDPWFDTRKSEYQAHVLEAYVFSYGDPTASEQAHLEVLNRARMDPLGEADRLGIDLFEGVAEGEISGDPVQPLTFNLQLLEAARLHSQDMIDQDYFSHYSPDNSSPFDRMTAAGYQYQTAGENIAFSGSTIAQNEIDKVLEMHDRLFIDEGIEGRGHRINICNENFKEVGIGVASGDYKGFTYSYMLTCDFGASSQETNSFLLGVVYDDQDSDSFYDAGEGTANVVIKVEESGSQTTTASAGGYGMPLPLGQYTVTATLPDGRTASRQITIGYKNVKVDFLLSQFSTSEEDGLTLNQGWNLISFWLQSADTNIASVLSAIAGKYVSVWAYINGSWKVYDPDNPGFSDLTTMEAGRGYWINMTESATLTVSGSDTSNTIELVSGWNLAGYNSSTSHSVADGLASMVGKYVSVWAYINGNWKVYDPNNPGFSDLTTMEPGYGYWINTTEACTWKLP